MLFSIKSRLPIDKPEENPDRKKTDQEEKKQSIEEVGRRPTPEENRIFKPPSSPHFQTAAGKNPGDKRFPVFG
jgi:hypothetical protein